MSSSKPKEPAAARSTIHSRFIPREELRGFSAWAPGDLAGGATDRRSVPRPQAAASAVDPALLLKQQMREARQAGYQDGYRDGLVALDGFKQSFAAQTTAQIGVLVTSVHSELDALQQQMARSLAGTAIALSRQIVRSELSTRPECVALVAEQAIEALLQSAKRIVLRLHPDDLALVTGAAADTIAARGARLVGDAGVARGGCRVESDIGLVDATIEERWRRAAAAIGSEAPWVDPAAAQDPST